MTSLRTPALAGLVPLLGACGNGEPSAPALGGPAVAQAAGGQAASPVVGWSHGPTPLWNEGTDGIVGRIDAEGSLWFSGEDTRGRFGILERLVPCDTGGFRSEICGNAAAKAGPVRLTRKPRIRIMKTTFPSISMGESNETCCSAVLFSTVPCRRLGAGESS